MARSTRGSAIVGPGPMRMRGSGTRSPSHCVLIARSDQSYRGAPGGAGGGDPGGGGGMFGGNGTAPVVAHQKTSA